MNNRNVYLHGIATHVPKTGYTQEEALGFMLKLMGNTDEKEGFLRKIYSGSAIEKRYSIIEDYNKDPSE